MKKRSLKKEISLQDIWSVINDFATNVDQRFEKIDAEIFAMRANMATKQYIIDVKADIQEAKNETIITIDKFAVRQQAFDLELLSIRSRFERLEGFMRKVARKLNMEKEAI